jgi:FKBP-type peptidyl-prolyl cis-trans isomerase
MEAISGSEGEPRSELRVAVYYAGTLVSGGKMDLALSTCHTRTL